MRHADHVKEKTLLARIFSSRFSEAITNRGIKQKELAEQLNIRAQTLSRYKSGTRLPDTAELYRIAKFFGVSIDWLLGKEANKLNREDILNPLDAYIASPEEARFINKNYTRYKNFYLFVTKEQLLSIIEKPRLKLSRTSQTNDCTENLAKGETAVSYDALTHGYICLSSTISSPMMWGQYAARSTGACLVFSGGFIMDTASPTPKLYLGEYMNRHDPSKVCFASQDAEVICLYKVNYTDKRLEPDAPLEQRLTTKSLGWEHEQEYRIIVPLSKASAEEDPSNGFTFNYFCSDLIRKTLSRVVLAPLSELNPIDLEKRINEAMKIGSCGTAPIRVSKATLDTQMNLIHHNLDKLPSMHGWKYA